MPGSKKTNSGRASRKLLETIHLAAAAEAVSTREATLNRLAQAHGYGTWGQLADALPPAPDNPFLQINPAGSPATGCVAMWERDERQLRAWFERPFLVIRPPFGAAIYSLDGRLWEKATVIAQCGEFDELFETIEIAKKSLCEYWASSEFFVTANRNNPERFDIQLRWSRQSLRSPLIEILGLMMTKEAAFKREALLREIRCERMLNLEQLFLRIDIDSDLFLEGFDES